MKIIADTHIFYYLGEDAALFESVKAEPIAPNLYNILELCTTQNLIDKEDYVREAHRKLFHFKNAVIFEPPFLHVAKMLCGTSYDVEKEFGVFLDFSAAFAAGGKINPEKIEEFRTWANVIRSNADVAADFANKKLQEIRPNIDNKRAHRKKDTTQLTMGLVNNLVGNATKGECNLEEKNLEGIELLIKTVDYYFKELEVSQMKMQPNDLVDFSMLAYVQPGDKFWTEEKRWRRMITEAGCQDYLYKLQ